MIIDSHAHVILPMEKQISMMNEAGIDKTILFSTTPHPENATDLESFEKEMSLLTEILTGKRSFQERMTGILSATKELVEILNRNSARFIGFGNVPLSLSYHETATWIERNIASNYLRGLGEFSPASGQIQLLDTIFKSASDFGNLPIWVHTFHPLAFEDIKELFSLSGKYPGVPLILGHAGGVHWFETMKIAKSHPKVYIDLSATFNIFTLMIAIKELPERTLFSSDAPHGDPFIARQMVERVCKDSYIQKRVLGESITELLNL